MRTSKKEADNLIRREKDSADTESRAAVKSQQGKIERTTLGDIDAFSQLKQQFDEAGEKALVEAKAKIATKEADAAVEAPVAEAKVDVPATEVVEEAPVVEDVVEIADVKASDETTTEDVAEETANDIAESSDEKAPSDDVAEA